MKIKANVVKSKNSIDKSIESQSKSKKERDRMMAIVSSIADPIIVLTKNNRVSLFNKATKDILGLKSKTLNKKISPKNNYSINNFKAHIKTKIKVKQIDDPENGSVEEIYFKKKNQEVVYKVITSQISMQGERGGIIKLFHNITREKKIDKMKSEFISIAAHQLRTPLAAIKWTIEMVLEERLGNINKEQKDVLMKGYVSNDRVINLVNDLLNVSRIEEKRFGYSFVQTDFNQLLSTVINNFTRAVKNKKIDLKVKRLKEDIRVYLDKQKIYLVFQNLLDNAIKYTLEGGSISIETKKQKDRLLVTISDNGIGIPKRDQEKIFGKFYRASNSSTVEKKGTGFGLYIAKAIIEKHGGKIWFESEEKKGTTFSLVIPIKKKINQKKEPKK